MPDRVITCIPVEFEREVESALVDASIYDIGSYGWLNENDADPEFIGRAMWQTDQPSLEYTALFGDSPVQRRPEEIEKDILIAGEDFCGLMQASRLSIGLTLLWKQQAHKNPLNESPFFWVHHTDAYLKLAIASDRLRDLLIVACTGSSAKPYKDKAKRNRLYVTPYEDAGTLLAARGLDDQRLVESLTALPVLAKQLFTYIDRRNEIVHEVATRMAKRVHESLSELQERYDHEQEHGFSPPSHDPAEWAPVIRARHEELRSEIDRATLELQEWYMLLVRASNSVFEVEYWSRVLEKQIL